MGGRRRVCEAKQDRPEPKGGPKGAAGANRAIPSGVREQLRYRASDLGGEDSLIFDRASVVELR